MVYPTVGRKREPRLSQLIRVMYAIGEKMGEEKMEAGQIVKSRVKVLVSATNSPFTKWSLELEMKNEEVGPRHSGYGPR